MGSGVGLVAAVVAPFNDWSRASKARVSAADQCCSNAILERNAESSTWHSYGSTYVGTTLDGTSRLHSSPERLRQNSTGFLNCVPEDGSAMEFEQGGPMYTGGAPLDEDEEDNEWVIDEELAKRGLYRGSYPRLLALYTLAPLTSVVVFTFLAFFPQVVYRTISPSPYPYAPYLPFPIPELLVSLALWSLAHLLRDPSYALISLVTCPFQSISATFLIFWSTSLHSVLSILLHQAAIPLLLIPHYMSSLRPTWHDPAFRRVWWVALGWAAAESIVGIKQGYEGIALYRDVLVTVRRSVELGVKGGSNFSKNLDAPSTSRLGRNGGGSPHTIATATISSGSPSIESRNSSPVGLQNHDPADPYGLQTIQEDSENRLLLPRRRANGGQQSQLEDALRLRVDRDLEQLIALKNREELEEAYGMPVIQIPIFISCLQRLNALIFPLGSCLLLSAAYLRSTLASLPKSSGTSPIHPREFVFPLSFSKPFLSQKSNTQLIVTLLSVIMLQVFVAILHTPLVLPRLGVHTVVYIGLLISLGTLFAGLGVWEALS